MHSNFDKYIKYSKKIKKINIIEGGGKKKEIY